MCYNAKSILRRELILALRSGAKQEEIDIILDKLKAAEEHHSFHYANGYTHPKLLVQTNEPGSEPQFMMWGLIPSWCKDEQQAKEMSDMTLNARSESIFEKPAFRDSAIHKRCVIAIDGYYEYLEQNKMKYPFYVEMKEGPMKLAGLWSEWVNKNTGEINRTVTIVTTNANPLLEIVHNTKKRMPVILNDETQKVWLNNNKDTAQLFIPFNQNEIRVHSTKPILGKYGVGNTEEASMKFEYPELVFVYAELENL